MEKVNELLKQAWHEAAKQGIALDSVHFDTIGTMSGQFSLASHSIEGRSMSPSNNSKDKG